MNKLQIEKRLLELSEQIEKLNAEILSKNNRLNVLQGSKQECFYWLDKINKKTGPLMTIEDIKEMIGENQVEVVDLGHYIKPIDKNEEYDYDAA